MEFGVDKRMQLVENGNEPLAFVRADSALKKIQAYAVAKMVFEMGFKKGESYKKLKRTRKLKSKAVGLKKKKPEINGDADVGVDEKLKTELAEVEMKELVEIPEDVEEPGKESDEVIVEVEMPEVEVEQVESEMGEEQPAVGVVDDAGKDEKDPDQESPVEPENKEPTSGVLVFNGVSPSTDNN